MTRRVLGLTALVLLAAAPAVGADQWLTVEPGSPDPGQAATVRLWLGDHFEGEERLFDPTTTILFQHIWKNGRENLDGVPGEPPLARLTTGRTPGVELIVHSAHSPKTVHAARYSKAVLVIGAPETGGSLALSEVGQRLELVPQTDPVTLLRKGGSLEVQLLWEREPLADVVVFAMPRSAPIADLEQAKTDEIGLVTFHLDRPGPWLIGTAYKAPCDDCGDYDVERQWATLTLVAGPR